MCIYFSPFFSLIPINLMAQLSMPLLSHIVCSLPCHPFPIHLVVVFSNFPVSQVTTISHTHPPCSTPCCYQPFGLLDKLLIIPGYKIIPVRCRIGFFCSMKVTHLEALFLCRDCSTVHATFTAAPPEIRASVGS